MIHVEYEEPSEAEVDVGLEKAKAQEELLAAHQHATDISHHFDCSVNDSEKQGHASPTMDASPSTLLAKAAHAAATIFSVTTPSPSC